MDHRPQLAWNNTLASPWYSAMERMRAILYGEIGGEIPDTKAAYQNGRGGCVVIEPYVMLGPSVEHTRSIASASRVTWVYCSELCQPEEIMHAAMGGKRETINLGSYCYRGF